MALSRFFGERGPNVALLEEWTDNGNISDANCSWFHIRGNIYYQPPGSIAGPYLLSEVTRSVVLSGCDAEKQSLRFLIDGSNMNFSMKCPIRQTFYDLSELHEFGERLTVLFKIMNHSPSRVGSKSSHAAMRNRMLRDIIIIRTREVNYPGKLQLPEPIIEVKTQQGESVLFAVGKSEYLDVCTGWKAVAKIKLDFTDFHLDARLPTLERKFTYGPFDQRDQDFSPFSEKQVLFAYHATAWIEARLYAQWLDPSNMKEMYQRLLAIYIELCNGEPVSETDFLHAHQGLCTFSKAIHSVEYLHRKQFAQSRYGLVFEKTGPESETHCQENVTYQVLQFKAAIRTDCQNQELPPLICPRDERLVAKLRSKFYDAYAQTGCISTALRPLMKLADCQIAAAFPPDAESFCKLDGAKLLHHICDSCGKFRPCKELDHNIKYRYRCHSSRGCRA